MGTRKDTDLREICSPRPSDQRRFEAGLPWSERAHADALRSGVAVEQVSTLQGGTRAKTPQNTRAKTPQLPSTIPTLGA